MTIETKTQIDSQCVFVRETFVKNYDYKYYNDYFYYSLYLVTVTKTLTWTVFYP